MNARDVLLVLTGPPIYTQLTRVLGWTRPEVAGWITAAVLRELFDVDTPANQPASDRT